MNNSLLISTTNPGKVREYMDLLEPYGITIVSPSDMVLPEVVEDGKTFEENAVKKALAYAQATNMPCLADDSGIAIDALLGQPGVFSSRWAASHNIETPPGMEDAANRQLILEQLKKRSNISALERTARFVCVVCLGFPDGKHFIAQGKLEGLVTTEERGQFGFGYDQIFQPINHTKTMAELRIGVKNQISHRARALHALLPRIVLELTGEEM